MYLCLMSQIGNNQDEQAVQGREDADGWLGWSIWDKQDTRQKILMAAFREIHRYGYQASSIQSIITQAGVTKGALYHHFESKHQMAVALIEEVHFEYVEHTFIRPMATTRDPISVLIDTLYSLEERMTDEMVALGCPLDSLAQEMAPVDQDIQQCIERLYQRKQRKLVEAFQRGQAAGTVKADIAAESIALLIMASLQGCMGIAKSARSVSVLIRCGTGLIHYLEQLRATEDASHSGE